ncbi:L-histidine N(alpha)-methyltransferase [Pseudoroseomonas globiformis]|uniref:L-histidine N(Alpha)-methyltransferase n=1 Tax=Teichococcus globiformis TaxID=2307229 RepID=A0ABV7G4X8_9PROT
MNSITKPGPAETNGSGSGDDHRPEMLADALAGLKAPRKTLPCKWLYDVEGAALFGEITRLPEYYPTRTEIGILRGHAAEIAAHVPAHAAVVEFGSGDGEKVDVLLDALEAPSAYVPVDIAPEWVAEAASKVAVSHPDLEVLPIAADFTREFGLPDQVEAAPRLGFFPGSTIGNFTPEEAVRFLARARGTLGEDAMFVMGADLVKPRETLVAAYDDAAGVTARFNLNLLRRLNRECGADFDLDGFEHVAEWNPELKRMEMHLRARRPQSVALGGERIDFAEGETIHTENSHKYTEEDLHRLAGRAGWQVQGIWTDPARLFSVSLLGQG